MLMARHFHKNLILASSSPSSSSSYPTYQWWLPPNTSCHLTCSINLNNNNNINQNIPLILSANIWRTFFLQNFLLSASTVEGAVERLQINR